MKENTNIKKTFASSYDELKFVGRGNSGFSFLVRHKVRQEHYVAKKIALEGLTDKRIERAFNEVSE